MRAFRLLILLLALLPGLLVPPGLVVRYCRCAPVRTAATTASSCCAAPTTPAEGSCPRCHADADRADPGPEQLRQAEQPWQPEQPGQPSATAKACACVWALPACDDAGGLPPAQVAALLPPLQLAWQPKGLPECTAAAALSPPQRLRAPPPPDHERNLPLRI
jgi:hypothetical protein